MYLLLIILTITSTVMSVDENNNNNQLRIVVYGDVHKNIRFFEEIFPWLMDNLGGYFSVNYILLGSGTYSVPQMCALNQLSLNTFMQAQFLKCEASGNRPELCLCQAGIDPLQYRNCVLTKGFLAREAYESYSAKYPSDYDVTPIIAYDNAWDLRGDHTQRTYLLQLCTLFAENQPFVCSNPLPYNSYKSAINLDCGLGYNEGKFERTGN